MDNDLWVWVGKAAVLVTVLTGIFKLVHYLRSPRGKLRLRLSAAPFHLPPSIDEDLKSAKEELRQAQQKVLDRISDPTAQSEAQKIMWLSDYHFPNLGVESRYLGGCWVGTVSNAGKRKVSGVTVRLPAAVMGVLSPQSGELTARQFKGDTLVVGDLRPKGRCEIVAWTSKRVTPHDLGEVHLTHDEGIGTITGAWPSNRVGFILGTLLSKAAIEVWVWLAISLLAFVAFVWIAGNLFPRTFNKTAPTPARRGVDASPSR